MILDNWGRIAFSNTEFIKIVYLIKLSSALTPKNPKSRNYFICLLCGKNIIVSKIRAKRARKNF